MSYTRTYTHIEPVHDTISVDYPASEHGGTRTVAYNGEVEVEITVTVDTDPFDYSVARTAKNVENLTYRIRNTQEAQVATIKESCQKVSGSMINGFYSLVRKDLSGQKAEEYSKLQSKLAMLMETSKALEDKFHRMDQDISRIQRHYSNIFQDIDENLSKRIGELNKNSFYMADRVREDLILGPGKKEAAFGLDQSIDVTRSNSLMTTARMRKKISDVMNHISGYLLKSTDYRTNLARILNDQPTDGIEWEFVPAIICRRTNLMAPDQQESAYAAPKELANDIYPVLKQFDSGRQPYDWQRLDSRELEQIDQAYAQYVQNAAIEGGQNTEADNRVYKLMMEMWQNSKNQMETLR